MKYRVKVKNPNKMFIVNNKPVRSPFQCFITEDNLSLIKSRIKFYGLSEKDYEIELLDDLNNEQKKDYSLIHPKREPDKTIREEKSIIVNQNQQDTNINKTLIKPKQKVLIKEEEIVHKQLILPRNEKIKETTNINVSEKIEETTNEEVYTKTLENTEQILNNESIETEVKIEELTIKSESILEKFLKSEF